MEFFCPGPRTPLSTKEILGLRRDAGYGKVDYVMIDGLIEIVGCQYLEIEGRCVWCTNPLALNRNGIRSVCPFKSPG